MGADNQIIEREEWENNDKEIQSCLDSKQKYNLFCDRVTDICLFNMMDAERRDKCNISVHLFIEQKNV